MTQEQKDMMEAAERLVKAVSYTQGKVSGFFLGAGVVGALWLLVSLFGGSQ